MNGEENDKLWELLGKASQPAVSPFFARNVLRAVRAEAEASRPWFWRLTRALHRRSLQFALAGTCMVAILVAVAPSAFVRHHHGVASRRDSSAPPEIVANPDYEVIAHLDELMADEESSLWLDDSAHSKVN